MGSRGHVWLRWENSDGNYYDINLKYKKMGSVFSRYFGAKISLYRYPLGDYTWERSAKGLFNQIEGIHEIKYAFSTFNIYIKKESDSDVDKEHSIIRNILRNTGSDFEDIGGVQHTGS